MDAAHRRHGGHEGHRDAQVGRLLVQGGGQVDGARVVDVVLISLGGLFSSAIMVSVALLCLSLWELLLVKKL